MQTAADLKLQAWATGPRAVTQTGTTMFVLALVVCTACSAAFASWLPLQVSVITVFLFAGPHNWFELRYFLSRLPARFGKSRNFFLTAFAGIGVLTLAYISLPIAFNFGAWSEEAISTAIASWNSLLRVWIGVLVWLRARQKRRSDSSSDWSWFPAVLLAVGAANWFAPMFFSLAIVYAHPLVALWFLDRHLARTRPEWLRAYRRFVLLLPVVLALMIWNLAQSQPLNNDNGLFWRITQHSGAALLPTIPSHLLVSVHLFLEMLHYAVWIIALPLIGSSIATGSSRRKFWNPMSLPLTRHPRGFPKLIRTMLVLSGLVVVALWFAFATDYSTTRDIYFTVAMAHVLAEAPFLLKML